MPDLYTANPPVPTNQILKADLKPQPEAEPKWKLTIDKVLTEAGESPRRVMMGAYHVRPGERFITQQQDEEVVLLLRAHPITNIRWILLVIIMIMAPFIFTWSGIFKGVDVRYLFIGRLTWWLMTLAVALENFMQWYYSIFIVTNERLVDIDFNNLLHRVITNTNLNHIEEPAMVTGGLVRSLFQYGDVRVTTASEVPTIEAHAVPWPHRVIDIISRLSEELEKRREVGE